MIKVKVKSLWHGQVGIPEKYVTKAIGSEGLRLTYKDEQMFIPAEKIPFLIKGYSQEFQDRFSQEKYRLVYFDWKPNQPKQTKLL